MWKKTITKVYNLIYFAFVRHKLPAKPWKRWRPTKNLLEVLGLEIAQNGLNKPAPEKMQNLLSITAKFIQKWHVRTLQVVFGLWNWSTPLSRPDFSILLRIYKLSSSDFYVVKATSEVKHELWMSIALAPLLLADVSSSQAKNAM